jgi:parvulin-like peptidyl-prolyl isomerase
MTIRTIILTGLILYSGIGHAEQMPVNGIVAIVNDAIITDQQMLEICESDIKVQARILRDQQRFEAKRKAILEDALRQLVERQLILEDFKQSGVNLPETYIDEEIRDQIRRRYGDRASFTKSLRADGITFERFRQRARDEIILAAMEQKNIRSAIIISPRKIEGYYVAHLDKYKVDNAVQLRMIVLRSPGQSRSEAVMNRALEIRAKLAEGVSFAEMAKVYSDGSQGAEGGSMGWREYSKLNPGLRDIAFRLPLNTSSKVIGLAHATDDDFWWIEYGTDGKAQVAKRYQANSGQETLVEEKTGAELAGLDALPPPSEYYLMLVEDKKLAHVKPLEEVRDEIEKELVLQERARLRTKWIDRLKQKSFVRYF